MNMRLRVSAVALPIEIGELDANLARIRGVLDSMEAAGPHLIVFPELATSGYVFTDAEEARGLSMRADDPEARVAGGWCFGRRRSGRRIL